MSEAKINVSTGFGGGVSVSLRADNASELLDLQEQLRIAAAADLALAAVVAPLIGNSAGVTNQAQANVQAAFPQAQPVSTVGQPLPVPQAAPAPWNQPVAQPQFGGATPPGLVDPGPCVHGARQYKDSMARGTQWRRWECAIPWSKGAQGRCKPVDA